MSWMTAVRMTQNDCVIKFYFLSIFALLELEHLRYRRQVDELRPLPVPRNDFDLRADLPQVKKNKDALVQSDEC